MREAYRAVIPLVRPDAVDLGLVIGNQRNAEFRRRWCIR